MGRYYDQHALYELLESINKIFLKGKNTQQMQTIKFKE